MSRRWLLSLLCLALALFALFFVQRSKANSALSVNESATRFLIQDEAIVKLTVANPLTRQLTAQLRLELLDTKDLPRMRSDEYKPLIERWEQADAKSAT